MEGDIGGNMGVVGERQSGDGIYEYDGLNVVGDSDIHIVIFAAPSDNS
jgi:hypothetical protein